MCDLDAKIDHRAELQRLAGNLMLEGLAFQKFHRNEGSSLGLANLVDRADVGMIQRRCSSRFPPEAAESFASRVEHRRAGT